MSGDDPGPAASADALAAFAQLDVRVGRVTQARPIPEARKPAYRLTVDLGAELGTRVSSAQLTALYRPDDLVGRQVLAVVNLPPRQVGPVRSEVLVLGVPDGRGGVVLAVPERDAPLGGRLF